jgi:phosphoglycolate phosphatase
VIAGSSLRAIAFDLDGTLVDTTADIAASVNWTLYTLGLKTLPEGRVHAFMGSGVDKLLERSLQAVTPDWESVGVRVVRALFGGHYREHLFERSRVPPGVLTKLRSLASHKVPMACVTNKQAEFALPLLKAAELSRFFEFTVSPDRDTDLKPSPRMLLRACERFEIDPGKLLYVGDSQLDKEAATAAGCEMAMAPDFFGSGGGS